MSTKSAGFELTIVLPASTCQEKLFKKLHKFLPEGTALTLTTTELTLSDVKLKLEPNEDAVKPEGAISVNM